jgi:predicted N-acetyltransferase YhbS
MTEFTLAPPEPLAAEGALAFALERAEDGPLVDDLIDRAFGPGRFAKTAERLREGSHLRADLSVCAWDGPVLVGAARQWPVRIGETPAMFLGPFAVEAGWRSRGLGGALISRACGLAQAAGERLTLLVGDMAYFGALGFQRPPAGAVVLPGPVDPRRVLWRSHRPGALDGVCGLVRPAPER